MITSDEVNAILPALAAVKGNLSGVKKGVKNTFFKSSYADLNTHLESVEPLLEENGLVLFQPVQNTVEGTTVSSRIYHVSSGQYVESSMKLVGDIDMQKAGSGITYARRYTLGSLLAMQTIDDDGNAAVGHTKNKLVTTQATQTPSTNDVTTTTVLDKVRQNNDRPSFRRPKTTTTPTTVVETSQDDI